MAQEDIVLRLIARDLASGQIKKVIENIKPAAKAVNDISTRMITWGKNVQWLGKQLTFNLTLPLVAFGTVATKAALDFDRGMREVAAAAGVASNIIDPAFKQLSDAAREIGRTTTISAKDAAKGLYELVSAGMDAADASRNLYQTATFAEAAQIDVGKAAQFAAQLLHIYGSEGYNAARITDIVSVSVQKSQAHFTDFVHNLQMAVGFAHTAGQSLEEVSTALAVLSNRGVPAARAGFLLRAVFSTMINPSKQAASVMRQLGITFFDANKQMKPFSQILTELRMKTEGLTQAEKLFAIATIFSRNAASAILPLLDETTQGYDEMLRKITQSTGVTEEMARTIRESLSGALQIARGRLGDVLIQIGNLLIPYLIRAISWLSAVGEIFTRLSPITQKWILAIAGVLAALGPLLVMVATGAQLLGILTKALAGVTLMTTLMTGVLGILLLVLGYLLVRLGLFEVVVEKVGDATNTTEAAFADFGKTASVATERAASGLNMASERMQDFQDQTNRATENFKDRLAEMVGTTRDKMADIKKQIHDETETFNKAQNEREKTFERRQGDMVLDYQRRVDDIEENIKREVARGAKGDAERLADLRKRLAREKEDYDREFARLQADYREDTQSVLTEHNKKITALQERLSKEEALLEQHKDIILSIRDVQVRDEIQKLIDSHERELAEIEKQKNKVINQSKIMADGVNAEIGRIGEDVDFEGLTRAGKDMGKAMAEGFKSTFSLRIVGTIKENIQFLKFLSDVVQEHKDWSFRQSAQEAERRVTEWKRGREFQHGGVVPGVGSRDSVPAMLTPGELVLTPEQQKLLAGRGEGTSVTVNINPGVMVASPGEQREFVRMITEAIRSDLLRQGLDTIRVPVRA